MFKIELYSFIRCISHFNRQNPTSENVIYFFWCLAINVVDAELTVTIISFDMCNFSQILLAHTIRMMQIINFDCACSI